MKIDHEIKDGTLFFKDLKIGNLLTGKELSWEEVKNIVILGSRFASKRPLKTRTLDELAGELADLIDERDSKKKKEDVEINNLKSMLRACEDRIEQQNIEINEWRTRYLETARTLQEREKGA